MEIRSDLKYTEDHEWISLDGDIATIGVTDFAQNSLGDIVYVELPEPGTVVEAGEAIGNIESVKAVSEVYSPVGGEVVDVNKDLEEEPETVNSGCYDEGWIVKIKVDLAEFAAAELMNDEEYAEFSKE